MASFFEYLLLPITIPMSYLLNFYIGVLGSPGLGIVTLSLTFSLLMIPVSIWARGIEKRVSDRTLKVKQEIAARRGNLKGEALFDITEKIYKENKYHPLHTLLSSAGILVMIPILISSIIVITQAEEIRGASFLFISDLSSADQILNGFNLLPFVMFIITLFDALIRYRNSPADIAKFMTISIVLTILVYPFSSGLLLFWITNNIYSLLMTLRRNLS